MEQTELQRAIEAILFAAGERVEASRLAFALETDEADIIAAADELADTYSSSVGASASSSWRRAIRWFLPVKWQTM